MASGTTGKVQPNILSQKHMAYYPSPPSYIIWNLQQKPTTTHRIWCENLAVFKTVQKIRSRKRPEFPNETLTILQAIRTKFRLHPGLSLSHVKGHQDKSIDQSELPFQSQVNIQADTLATSFQATSNHATAKAPLIPGTGCHLVIERQYLPSHHRRKMRTRRSPHQLLQYIQHKYRLTEVAMTHIDWKSHAQAIRHSQATRTIFLVKFLSKWLPVGKQVHRSSLQSSSTSEPMSFMFL
jgi:hypothetical protein